MPWKEKQPRDLSDAGQKSRELTTPPELPSRNGPKEVGDGGVAFKKALCLLSVHLLLFSDKSVLNKVLLID